MHVKMAISAKRLAVFYGMLPPQLQGQNMVRFQQSAQLAALTPIGPFKLAAEPIAHQHGHPKIMLPTGSEFLMILTQIGISPL